MSAARRTHECHDAMIISGPSTSQSQNYTRPIPDPPPSSMTMTCNQEDAVLKCYGSVPKSYGFVPKCYGFAPKQPKQRVRPKCFLMNLHFLIFPTRFDFFRGGWRGRQKGKIAKGTMKNTKSSHEEILASFCMLRSSWSSSSISSMTMTCNQKDVLPPMTSVPKCYGSVPKS